MIQGEFTGTAGELTERAEALTLNDIGAAIQRSIDVTQRGKQEIYTYQAAWLYALAQQYNRPGAEILEIGTYWGFSAVVMAQAAPMAHITTLNPTRWEWEEATANLSPWKNVSCVCEHSWGYFDSRNWKQPDMIFVDGDHKRIDRDLVWWDWLMPGGLMLFHDYSPSGSKRQCPAVYRALNRFAEKLGRKPDISIIDDGLAGLVGWYNTG